MSRKEGNNTTSESENNGGRWKLGKVLLWSQNKKGALVQPFSPLGFRNSIERHLRNNGYTVKITKNDAFQKRNKIPDAKLRINRRTDKEIVQHKPVIVPSDLEKIRLSPCLVCLIQPGCYKKKLVLRFLILVQSRKRGPERPSPWQFAFKKDANSREYAIMTHEEATKNHPGDETNNPSTERETRLHSTESDGDAFDSLELYVAKLNPSCTAFFQYPKEKITGDDTVWYENKPLGVNKLGEMMKTISVGANLSQSGHLR